ncbi:uncharacterized protein K452DRAFT_285502 [Aplosporella prunicola CBS 121167]|uniref:Secreted protein n=1 Tax=Aplosporella prunicola CBS 121167 TaxID=1176127 RepID=A0A6A6BJQ5_9PEZI|nr:uncharacterized protein K452DRAFT_285502 [Aplosporella prunicola CBS 121167]KAF2144256.1 hypothetical protein K452DRAFT_285502 [Aplosporella prunicola CBS 121167]
MFDCFWLFCLSVYCVPCASALPSSIVWASTKNQPSHAPSPHSNSVSICLPQARENAADNAVSQPSGRGTKTERTVALEERAHEKTENQEKQEPTRKSNFFDHASE